MAFHYNKDEGVITISTRSHGRGYNYPAIFVDVSKVPVSKAEAVSDKTNTVLRYAMESKLSVDQLVGKDQL